MNFVQTTHYESKVLLTSKRSTHYLASISLSTNWKSLSFSNTILIGLQPRGKFLAERIKQILESEYKVLTFNWDFWTLRSFVMILEEAKKPLEANKPKSIF